MEVRGQVAFITDGSGGAVMGRKDQKFRPAATSISDWTTGTAALRGS